MLVVYRITWYLCGGCIYKRVDLIAIARLVPTKPLISRFEGDHQNTSSFSTLAVSAATNGPVSKTSSLQSTKSRTQGSTV